jgi:hypothetical protein
VREVHTVFAVLRQVDDEIIFPVRTGDFETVCKDISGERRERKVLRRAIEVHWGLKFRALLSAVLVKTAYTGHPDPYRTRANSRYRIPRWSTRCKDVLGGAAEIDTGRLWINRDGSDVEGRRRDRRYPASNGRWSERLPGGLGGGSDYRLMQLFKDPKLRGSLDARAHERERPCAGVF